MTGTNNGECQNFINQVKAYINAHAPKNEASLLEDSHNNIFQGHPWMI